MAQKDTFSLFDLNEYLKRVVALNFPEPVWISCEIAQIKNARGNYYLDLIEVNDNEEVIAQSQAAIWYKSYLFIKTKFGDLLPSLLQEGVKVKIKVNVEFNERYGLKLIIEDIDPAYTLGQMELARQKILERLKHAGVIEKNKSVTTTRVWQRIAIISSDTAAGYRDFIAHLQENKYGYNFHVKLFTAAMQGLNTEKEVVERLQEIKADAVLFDAVVIIRGGGSKMDLSYFDNYNIGFTIANMPIPVLTGIGHEIDLSIADMVAFMSLKTPTAVADFLVEKCMQFEAQMEDWQKQCNMLAGVILRRASLQLEGHVNQLQSRPKELIRFAGMQVSQLWNEGLGQIENILKYKHLEISSISATLQLSDPTHILKRGFVMVSQQNRPVTRKQNLDTDKEIKLTFYDGEVILGKQ